jgi:hypothetical protein
MRHERESTARSAGLALRGRYDDLVTSSPSQPGDRRPRLERPPGERYRPVEPADDLGASRIDRIAWPAAVVVGTALVFTILGGLMTLTAGLIVVAGFAGWLIGKLVSPPPLAAVVGIVAVVLGFLGIWAFGRIEGGVLDPIDYLAEVEGWVLVGLCLLAGGGLAAAASR